MSLWYDVSGLYNWRGNFTGIQRVAYNLAKALLAKNPDIRFFVFQSGGFREIELSELEGRLNTQVSIKLSPRDMDSNHRSSRAILQHYGMIAAKEIAIGSRIEKPLRKTYSSLRKTYRGVRSKRATAPMQAIFSKNDVVIVVDGNWQFSGFAESIIQSRERLGFKLVHFVHDLVAVKNPALASKNADKIIGGYFRKIFPHSDMLIAVSESTKRDIEWFLQANKFDAVPVTVVRPGSETWRGTHITSRPDGVVEKEFILAVSTVEIRKNYMLLYYAYKQAARNDVKLPHLFIAGRKGWHAEETYQLLRQDPEIAKHITLLGGVLDEELSWLYKNCLFTVFPAFYEGWGLTVAESFSYGKACITSDTSSMPEVGLNMALYVSPYGSSEMVAAIQKYTNKATRKKAEQKILEGYKARAWSSAAAELLGALQSVYDR